jgi:hypothetical protein
LLPIGDGGDSLFAWLIAVYDSVDAVLVYAALLLRKEDIKIKKINKKDLQQRQNSQPCPLFLTQRFQFMSPTIKATTIPTTQQTTERLQQWHRVVSDKDFALLMNILADDVEFHSPTVWQPKQGKQITTYILKTVIGIFEDFTYHRQFVDGNSVALEFSAKIGDKNIKGMDLIRWNEQGQIDHFEVLIRPLNGLQVLLELMTAELQKAGFVAKE